MSARDTRDAGSIADAPGHEDYTPEQLAAMRREDLDRLGARYDGVEILHVEPGPEPGSALEKRAVRQVGTLFFLAGLFAFLFVVVYVGSDWFLPDWQWATEGTTWSALFTPLLGVWIWIDAGSSSVSAPKTWITRLLTLLSGLDRRL